eukprot:1838314-Rhodomonas_salina.3
MPSPARTGQYHLPVGSKQRRFIESTDLGDGEGSEVQDEGEASGSEQRAALPRQHLRRLPRGPPLELLEMVVCRLELGVSLAHVSLGRCGHHAAIDQSEGVLSGAVCSACNTGAASG